MDDDSDSREVIAAELTLYGANTIVSESADDAIRKMETFRPDVIVADISMLEFSGIEASHQLHERGSTPKVVFLTIHTRR